MIYKILNVCFDKWWRPLLFFGITLAIFFVALQLHNDFFVKSTIVFCAFALFLLGVSVIYQLIYKRWIKALVTAGILGATIAAVFIYIATMFFIETVDGDQWAVGLKIPTDIPIEYPVDLNDDDTRPDSVSMLRRSHADLQLYNSFQPGLYEYDFWYGKIEKGEIFLKAFEITKNIPLSEERLPESSTLKVVNQTDSILKFHSDYHFTIYEGDWGDPYAARFEVWFRPDSGGKERKLFSKNYVIEGWQR